MAVEQLVVLDESVLVKLAADLGDAAYPPHFAGIYLDMLPGRVRRVEEAVLADDPVAAMDAALSLRVSSTSVGLVELAGVAAVVEDAVRREDRSAQLSGIAPLASTARRGAEVLRAMLAR